tara:strand:- start:3380 stop:3763 length:384 start_codon:yes stop_codon:yes gene_type:complete
MLTALIAPVSNLLGKFIEDKDMKNKLAHEVATMAENHANELAKGQIEINKAEASHKSIFVAGWRPFIGWTCGIALCWHFVLQPVTLFVCTYIGLTIPTLPEFDMGSLMTILGGLLGLGGLRTYEKQK